MNQLDHPVDSAPTASTTTTVPSSVRMIPPRFLKPQFGRPYTADEEQKLHQCICELPVSPELDNYSMKVLHTFVGPRFESSAAATIVHLSAITQAVHQRFPEPDNNWTDQDTTRIINRVFKSGNKVVFGQLEVERDPATNSLVVKLNRENHERMVDFMIANNILP